MSGIRHTDYDCTCTYDTGLTIRICSKFPMGTKWIGDEGWIFVTRGELKASSEAILKEVIGPEEIQLYKSRDHFGNFIECVKSRKETIAPAEIAHRSASVGHLCLIAIDTGRKIQWDPKTERIKDDAAASALLAPPPTPYPAAPPPPPGPWAEIDPDSNTKRPAALCGGPFYVRGWRL